MALTGFLKDRSIEDLSGVLKVNKVLFEVGLTLAFVPLEKNFYSSPLGDMHKMYIHQE
jgi:hypothetical protein